MPKLQVSVVAQFLFPNMSAGRSRVGIPSRATPSPGIFIRKDTSFHRTSLRFVERLEFECREEAEAYGERRAHNFVDCSFTVQKE